MACTSDKASTFIRIICIICALALIGLGLLRFFTQNNITILEGIWTVYWIIFGLILIIVEIGIKFISNQFGFLSSSCGKGMFVVFCGTLLIDNFSDPNTVHESIAGIILMVAGFAIIVIGYSALPSQQFPPPTQAAAV